VAEWLKAHAWKACIWQHIEGSNPFLSAKNECFLKGKLFLFYSRTNFLVCKCMENINDLTFNGKQSFFVSSSSRDNKVIPSSLQT